MRNKYVLMNQIIHWDYFLKSIFKTFGKYFKQFFSICLVLPWVKIRHKYVYKIQ